MKQKMIKKMLAASISAALAFAPIASNACTSFLLKGSDGGTVYGRSMEFGIQLASQMMAIPKGYQFKGIGTDGKYGSGMSWTTKYAAAGMNGLNQPILFDGMNEKGLTGGLLNFPNSASFPVVAPADSANSINASQLLTYVLTNYSTVDEIKTGLRSLKVNGAKLGFYGNQVPAAHFTFHDAAGKSVVVEYIKGQLVLADNPVGVMTNDPPFQDHLNNIGNYSNLSKVEQPPRVINGVAFPAPSSGNGLHGLPGDFLSPSRFIRALFLADSVPKTFTTADMDAAAWHILGSFDIPPGSVTLPASNPYGGGAGGYETTEWVVVANNKSMTYNVKMYANNNIYTFDMKKMDMNAKDIKYTKLDQPKLMVPIN